MTKKQAAAGSPIESAREVAGPKKKAVKKKAAKKKPPAKVDFSIFPFRGSVDDNPSFTAQELAFDAMDAVSNGDVDRAIELALRAIEIDRDCIDARLLLTEIDPRDDDAELADLIEIVADGERALGKRFFKENAGMFWGLLETRPYMRARAALAALLIEKRRYDEAALHYWEMLRLNPNDNQGVRYVLVGLSLETRDFAGFAKLFELYPDEWSPMFKWARVLERFLADDLAGAASALPAARDCNPHVEKFLIGKKRMPKRSPPYYSPGDVSEAVVCMIEIGHAWKSAPAATKWLKAQIAATP